MTDVRQYNPELFFVCIEQPTKKNIHTIFINLHTALALKAAKH